MHKFILHSIKTGLQLAALLLFVTFVNSVAPAMAQTAGATPPDLASAYVLGIGDKLHVITFGEETLSGDFEVSSTGMLAMPLIGEIKAAGETVATVKERIVSALNGGYLRDPKVSVAVLNYRPFFILGEVMKPGSYPYTNNMSVINAVATAGGYTYRADKEEIMMKHGANDAKETPVKEETPVQPGDVIRVPERFF